MTGSITITALESFGSLRGHVYSVSAVCSIPSLNLLVSGDEGGTLNLWCLSSRQLLDTRTLTVQILHVFSSTLSTLVVFAQLRNGSIVAYGITSNNDKFTEAPITRLPCARYSYCRASISFPWAAIPGPDTDHLLVVDCTSKETIVEDFPNMGTHGNIMAVSLDGPLLFCGFEDGHVCGYRISEETMSAELAYSHQALDESITCLCFDSNTLYIGGAADYIVAVQDPLGAATIMESVSFRDNGISTIVVHGDLIFSAGWDGKLRIFERQDLHMCNAIMDGLYDVILHMDIASLHRPVHGKVGYGQVGLLLATVGKDKVIKLWALS